jgi:hypothetical protein
MIKYFRYHYSNEWNSNGRAAQSIYQDQWFELMTDKKKLQKDDLIIPENVYFPKDYSFLLSDGFEHKVNETPEGFLHVFLPIKADAFTCEITHNLS